MKSRSRFGAALCSLALGIASVPAIAGNAPVCTGPAVELPPVCKVQLPSPTVSCAVPADVAGQLAQPQLYLAQRASDLFSWQTFVGLHWPASKTERGVPNPMLSLGAPEPTVWETWREAGEVFRHDADGKPLPPLGWNDPSPTPVQCTEGERVLYRQSKVDDTLDDIDQPTGANGTLPVTLTDQHSKLTRYEIRMNRIAYQAITAPGNQWWDGKKQATLASVRFPSGSVIIKAAWTPVSKEDAGRFHTVNACVCDTPGPGGTCKSERVGLTGFHVMSKTPSAPQWIWSTFEQMDNVPGDSCAQLAPAGSQAPTYYSYSSAAPVNQQTQAGTPSQICRHIPIPSARPACGNNGDASDNVLALNQAMQTALVGTPFAHYGLISTQWPLPGWTPPDGPNTVFSVLPALLGNTTLESFIQGTSSCMGCHAMARTKRHASTNPADRGFVSSDFTFVLGLARPVLAPLPLLKGLSAADCQGTNATDPKCVGLAVAIDTYNQLPENTGALLHCSSCHLDAGRNPRASWWAGMIEKYSQPKYKDKGGIAGRINQCFENSLNGKALCTPNDMGLCPDNPQMNGLVAYMAWLSKPQNNPDHIPKPAHAFPAIGSGVGIGANGASIYLQKCAFCHGADGQGRYESNSYFRPALWGNHSFNAKAGMDSANDLAPFLYGNMPLGSGGELTKQEAMDLACYIDGQNRPAGSPPPNAATPSGVICGAPLK